MDGRAVIDLVRHGGHFCRILTTEKVGGRYRRSYIYTTSLFDSQSLPNKQGLADASR